MAQALPHKNEEIVSFIYNNKVDYLLISVGLTSKLQPLDLTVNRVFKNPYKKYTDYVASHKENFFKWNMVFRIRALKENYYKWI